MTAAIEVDIFDEQQRLVFSDEFEGSVELGRQSDPREPLFTSQAEGADRRRVAIAKLEEAAVSRRHVQIDVLPGGRVRVTNASSLIPLRVGEAIELRPGTATEVALPSSLAIGRRQIRMAAAERAEMPLMELESATIAPGSRLPAGRIPSLELSAGAQVDVDSVVAWLKAILATLQSATTSAAFFESAARAAVEVVKLETGRVLMLNTAGEWEARAGWVAPAHETRGLPRPSRRVLGRMLAQKCTVWQEPSEADAAEASLAGLNFVAVAPILDAKGHVVGALYGERCAQGPGSGFHKLEATLLEMLANGVSSGLARLEQEQAALAARVQFEQFFTRELAEELALRPDLLNGREVDVTLLFCDIRGFSRISEKLGPARTVSWISDVMGVLSDCVLAHRGVLVDYIGDEVIAMWGAPQDEPRHADLACRAALDMARTLPELNQRWRGELGDEFSFGIGINSGVAQVGNTGSRRKFKYGALGHNVNLASRVQGATKYLKTLALVTGSTARALGPEFLIRRLCQVEVVNIAQPVNLYELAMPGMPGWPDLKQRYEAALAEFELGEFRNATRTLANLIVDHPGDGPSVLLLGRAVQAMIDDGAPFDPVWRLPGK